MLGRPEGRPLFLAAAVAVVVAAAVVAAATVVVGEEAAVVVAATAAATEQDPDQEDDPPRVVPAAEETVIAHDCYPHKILMQRFAAAHSMVFRLPEIVRGFYTVFSVSGKRLSKERNW